MITNIIFIFMGMNKWRVLLLPLTLIYAVIITIRNKLFDWDILHSHHIQIPSIGVGNLALGGSGKSVVIDFLISIFKNEFHVAVLSRGYKRMTKGVVIADQSSSVSTIGDEPFQFFSKHQGVEVVVAEKRILGIKKLIQVKSQVDLLLLDDVLQHRYVKPSILILTTTYDSPYFSDMLLPVGNLRDSKSSVRRAEVILVTKCPGGLSEHQMNVFIGKLNINSSQKVFFTKIKYSSSIKNYNTILQLKELKNNFILVTGIANPFPLVNHLKGLNLKFYHLEFSDHHVFTSQDIVRIKDLKKDGKVLTTEKDFTRLSPLIENKNLFYLPIAIEFINPKKEIQFKNYLKKKL